MIDLLRARETSSTAGLADFTLGGAESIEFSTFAAEVGDGVPFPYIAELPGTAEYEEGIGYTSSGVLVRNFIIRNHLGTSVKVNFSAGTKSIFATRPHVGFRSPLNLFPSASAGFYKMLMSNHIASYATTYTGRSTQLWLHPFTNDFQGELNAWSFYVGTASAGAVMRAGIYLIDESTGGPVGTPWMESNDIDCGTTGLVTLSFASNTAGPTTAQRIPYRFFLGLAFENATVKVMGVNYTTSVKTWVAKNSNGADPSLYQGFTMGTPTPGVAALPAISSVSSRNENYPTGGFTQI